MGLKLDKTWKLIYQFKPIYLLIHPFSDFNKLVIRLSLFIRSENKNLELLPFAHHHPILSHNETSIFMNPKFNMLLSGNIHLNFS